MSYIYVSCILPAHGKINIRERATIRYLSGTLQEKENSGICTRNIGFVHDTTYTCYSTHFFWSFLLITNENGTDAYTT